MRKSFAEIALRSFALLWQNFVLTYPLLFFILLFSMLMPQGEEPALEPRWILFFAGFFLIFSGMMAGSFAMIARAVRLYLEREKNPPKPPAEGEPPQLPTTFGDISTILKEFFPGVGRHFVHFVAGLLVQIGAIWLISLWFDHQMALAGGFPAAIQKVQALQNQAAAGTNLDAAKFLASLTPDEKSQLNSLGLLMLSSMAMYGAFFFVTAFWPAFVVLLDKPVWSAYWQSLRQCIVRPLTLIATVFLFIGLFMLFSLLPQTGSALLAALWHFLTVMLFVYLGIVVVMTVADTHGLEALPPLAAEAGKGTVLDKRG